MNIDFEILHEDDSIYVKKDNGTEVNYFIFNEAEIHLNKILPHTVQEWHFHSKIDENLLITKGKLLCKYKDINGSIKTEYAEKNDVIRVHNSVHTFENDTDETVEFVVFRYVADGKDKREIIKSDKTIVHFS